MAAEPKHFADLFDHPSVEAMYALSPKEFERFVAYVLRRAGYEVKEVGPHFLHGVDLEMRLPGRARMVGGVECKKFAPTNLVKANVVMGVMGAPAVGRSRAKPYVITTSGFNVAAYQMAEAGATQAYLINGQQLIRYIGYIKYSRHDGNDDDTITTLSPEYFAGKDDTGTDKSDGAKILTIANNKGGVGKTTTAYFLGAELTQRGKRVLLIDLDGQANLTERCFPDWAAHVGEETEPPPNITHYFSKQRTLSDLVISANREHSMGIIPSDPQLTLRDLGGSGHPGAELRFARDVRRLSRHSLASLGGVPDWIIIDTPPALSMFARAGLAAADYVLAPVRPRTSSLRGTNNMMSTLQSMQALIGGISARFLGAVITHWDNLVLTQVFADTPLPPTVHRLGGQVFDTKIPIDNQLEGAKPGAQTPGAKKYVELVDELLRVVQPQPVSTDQVQIGAGHVVAQRGE